MIVYLKSLSSGKRIGNTNNFLRNQEQNQEPSKYFFVSKHSYEKVIFYIVPIFINKRKEVFSYMLVKDKNIVG